MEQQANSQHEEIEVLFKVDCDSKTETDIIDQFENQTVVKNETTIGDGTPIWSISEIAWYQAMVDFCNDGSVNMESAAPILTPGETATFEGIGIEGKSEMKTPLSCHGQGDGLDSPIFLCTPHPVLEDIHPGKELHESFAHASTPNLEKQQSGGEYQNGNALGCINFDTPHLFREPVRQEFNSANNRPSSSHQKKAYYPSNASPYALSYHPNKGRNGARQNLNCSEYQTPTPLKPPHIARLKTCSSSTSTSGSSYATTNDSDISSSFNSSDRSDRSSIESDTSPIFPKVPNNTPESESSALVPTTSPSLQFSRNQLQRRNSLAHQLTTRLNMWPNFPASDMRETHNAKERFRRSRIRDACNNLRNAVPTVNERTDNATVFEESYEYMLFLKECSGNVYDEEFSQLFTDKKCG